MLIGASIHYQLHRLSVFIVGNQVGSGPQWRCIMGYVHLVLFITLVLLWFFRLRFFFFLLLWWMFSSLFVVSIVLAVKLWCVFVFWCFHPVLEADKVSCSSPPDSPRSRGSSSSTSNGTSGSVACSSTTSSSSSSSNRGPGHFWTLVETIGLRSSESWFACKWIS